MAFDIVLPTCKPVCPGQAGQAQHAQHESAFSRYTNADRCLAECSMPGVAASTQMASWSAILQMDTMRKALAAVETKTSIRSHSRKTWWQRQGSRAHTGEGPSEAHPAVQQAAAAAPVWVQHIHARRQARRHSRAQRAAHLRHRRRPQDCADLLPLRARGVRLFWPHACLCQRAQQPLGCRPVARLLAHALAETLSYWPLREPASPAVTRPPLPAHAPAATPPANCLPAGACACWDAAAACWSVSTAAQGEMACLAAYLADSPDQGLQSLAVRPALRGNTLALLRQTAA